jgi:hypothetical protein
MSANVQLVVAAPPGALVIMTLNFFGGIALVDNLGQATVAPQTQTATATAPETTRPAILSATASVGSSTVTINFSEPVYCTGLSFDGTDFTISDFNSATIDPQVIAPGGNFCGSTPLTADTSFSLATDRTFPAETTFVITLSTEANEIQDVFGNDLLLPASVPFTTAAGDFTSPTLTDARIVNNVGSTNFADVGDSFSITFSETMAPSTGAIEIQDQDGTLLSLNCGLTADCSWNVATTIVTVTLMQAVPATGGTTPGLQIPANITLLVGFSDLQGNVPNVLGSADRLIDYEP